MIQKNIREVKILSAEFENGKVNFIRVSIDSWNPAWGGQTFTVEGGKEFSISTNGGLVCGATFEEIELIKQAYARAVTLDFSNFQIQDEE